MGNSNSKTLIIWIDEEINKNENKKKYQKKLDTFKDIEFECFDEIYKGIEFIKKIKFKKTIIITSGTLFPEIDKQLKNCSNELYFVPNIIIFTENKEKYIRKSHNSHIITAPFYNISGALESAEEIEEFLKKSVNDYSSEFKPNDNDKYNNEELKFLSITNKNELFLPIYYIDYFKIATEEEINTFNDKIFNQNKNITPISFLFSQLAENKKIPLSILSKYWIRAYSSHTNFSEKMNEKLSKKDYTDYLPIIQKLYEAVDDCHLISDTSKLYKGMMVDSNNWKPFLDNFKETENDLPSAILYGETFFSFYKDEDSIKKLRVKNENDIGNKIFINLILEKPYNYRFVRNNAIINEELSYFDKDDEILFFPFSCFEIKNIKKINDNEYNIILNYLEKYTKLFNPMERKNFCKDNIPDDDYSKLIFDSGIINQELIELSNSIENIVENKENDNLNRDSKQSNITSKIIDQTFTKNNEYMSNIDGFKEYHINNNNRNNNNGRNNTDYQNANNNIYNNNPNNNQNQNFQIFNEYNLNNNNNQFHQGQNNQYLNGYNNNNRNNNPIINIIKNLDDIILLSLVKLICSEVINQYYNIKNRIELQNIIKNSLVTSTQLNWCVNITDNLNNNQFSNISQNSLIILEVICSNNKFYIHIAKSSN